MKKVLFVDDEPWGHESLRYALELKGLECLIATEMTTALKIVQENEIAVVVTDIMMSQGTSYPNIDSQETGFHLVRILSKEHPRIRIVCLSVIGDQSKIRTLRQFRVEYIRKGEVTLATAVEKILKATGERLS
jgi:DNA-binding NarL/FixJ family response regulator